MNASTRVDGSDSPVLVPSYRSARSTAISLISLWSALDSDSRPTSLNPLAASPASTIEPIVVIDRSRTGRVIIPAWQNRQPLVQPRKISTLNRSCTVSASGTSGLAGYGQESRSITVCLDTDRGTPGRFGVTALIAPSGAVAHVVEPRHVHAAGRGQLLQQAVAAARPPGRLPGPDQLGDDQHGLLAVAEHGAVDELGDRLGVEGRVAACQHDRVVGAAVGRGQRDPGQVERRSAGWCSRARWRS